MKSKVFLLIPAFFLTFGIHAQEITGLWEISRVEVGEETMTPLGKWTRINADKTYESGNGWQQNSTGTWEYDADKRQYLPQNKYGIKDEYGAFTVETGTDEMRWERIEDGMPVRVTLQRIAELPVTSADLLPGIWMLKKVINKGEDISRSFDPKNRHYIFFRWDRIFIERTPADKRKSGFWHIHAHQPELSMIANEENNPLQRWRIKVDADSLKFYGMSGPAKDLEMQFIRMHEFPE